MLGGARDPLHSPRSNDGGSWQKSGLGRGKWDEFPFQSKEMAPKSQDSGTCVLKLSRLPLVLPSMGSKPAACPSSAFTLQWPFCSSPAGITSPSGFQRGFLGSYPLQKEERGSCLATAPALSMVMLEKHIPHPGWAVGDVRTQPGLGAGFQCWVGGREGKGGCKLGEKVRRAINKWHPGKEMSVCGRSNTAVPETGREWLSRASNPWESGPGQQWGGSPRILCVTGCHLGCSCRKKGWECISHKPPRLSVSDGGKTEELSPRTILSPASSKGWADGMQEWVSIPWVRVCFWGWSQRPSPGHPLGLRRPSQGSKSCSSGG